MFAKAKLAFTLVELLVVMAIFTVLLALLAPSLRKARDSAYEVSCKSNLKQFYFAFSSYAADNCERWPLVQVRPDSWIGYNNVFTKSPQTGTIFPYMDNCAKIYFCPALRFVKLNSGTGSNGRFDYSMLTPFSGARVERIRGISKWVTTAGWVDMPTPLLVEENSQYHMNNTYLDGAHGFIDRMSHLHRDGCNYVSTGGTVAWVNQLVGWDCKSWRSIAPSGTEYPLNSDINAPGKWDGM